MKLDRNITKPRRGKYALIKLRQSTITPHLVTAAIAADKMVNVEPQDIDFGDTDGSDFFVIRLKDKYAFEALKGYARAAAEDGEMEYAQEIVQLAERALHHPNKRKPD